MQPPYDSVMRTTITIDEHLLAEAKQAAARTGRTLTAVIEDALRESLARQAPARQPRRVKLPTFGRGGLMAGVDLDGSAALVDLMEEGDA
jgi:hypothetical protein